MTTVSMWQPPQFPGINHRDAVWNAILTHAGSELAVGEGSTVSFTTGTQPDDCTLCSRLRMSTGGADATLVLHVVWRQFPFQSMFQSDISIDDLYALPVALRDALIQGMTSVLAETVWPDAAINDPSHRPNELSVLASALLGDFAGDLPADVSWFDVVITSLSGEQIEVSVAISRSALLADELTQGILPAAVGDEARSQITVTAIFTLGYSSFTAHDMSRLTEGSVILLPRTTPDRRMLRIDRTVLEFRAADDAWLLAGKRNGAPRPHRHRYRKQDVTNPQDFTNPMQPPDADDASATAVDEHHAGPTEALPGVSDEFDHSDLGSSTLPVLLGASEEEQGDDDTIAGVISPDEQELVPEGIRIADLGITVDFDIGEKDFTLAEIETWRPGAVVALDPPALAGRVAVTLRVNGHAIAAGDLIAIDDRLAVRLSRLLLRP